MIRFQFVNYHQMLWRNLPEFSIHMHHQCRDFSPRIQCGEVCTLYTRELNRNFRPSIEEYGPEVECCWKRGSQAQGLTNNLIINATRKKRILWLTSAFLLPSCSPAVVAPSFRLPAAMLEQFALRWTPAPSSVSLFPFPHFSDPSRT
jgi:hypothetical protein